MTFKKVSCGGEEGFIRHFLWCTLFWRFRLSDGSAIPNQLSLASRVYFSVISSCSALGCNVELLPQSSKWREQSGRRGVLPCRPITNGVQTKVEEEVVFGKIVMFSKEMKRLREYCSMQPTYAYGH